MTYAVSLHTQSAYEASKPYIEKGKALLCRLSKAALETAKKIWHFVLRHKKEIILYSLIGGVLLLCGLALPKVAMVLLPGLGYMLCFSNGTEIPSDVLEKIKPNRKTGVWLPSSLTEVSHCPSLTKRIQTKSLVKNRLQNQPASKGWTILQGESGSGKIAFLMELGRELAAEGHPVYLLDTTSLKNGTVNGIHDTRFNVMATHLNGISIINGKVPILLIDEVTSVLNTSSTGFSDSFKSEAFFPLKFQILATTTTQGTQKIQGNDNGILGRFAGGIYTMPDLDEPSAIEILKHARGSRIDGSISDDLITDTVQKMKNVPQNERMRIIFDNLFYGKGPITAEIVNERMHQLGDVTRNHIFDL